jgi:hypothetical protein
MKKSASSLWILVCLFACMQRAGAADIYVAVTGDDHNAGTAAQPKATLQAALRQAREWRRLKDPAIAGGIHIIVKGGTYFLYEPVFIRPEDAGTPGSPTIIEAAPGEQPVFSGGVVMKDWKPVKGSIAGLPAVAKGKIWATDVPALASEPFNFRQLWVNNQKATRAQDANGDSMNRILSWNRETGTCWIPTPHTPGLQQATGLELFIHQWWAIASLRINHIEVHNDSTLLSFYQPESKIQSEHPWPAPWQSKESGNSAFHLTNALQLLDEPGEWYLDVKAQKLYYWPRTNENLATATVVAPALETVVSMSGTIDRPVSYVFFKGISFQHTDWLRPSRQGHVPLQSGLYLLDAYKLKIPGTPDKKGLENQAWVGRPAAAVEAMYTNHTGFEACRFEHLASTGLDYKRGNHNDTINGNLFSDIGGTGIQLGVYSDEAFEAHLPYLPTDLREVCSHTQITNNLVTNVTNEDWGTLGISTGYVREVTIAHNEVNEVSYSGISVGWGWTKTINVMSNNKVLANKIHHYARHMYDVAAVYTLSAQPGSMISGNYIDSIYKAPYAHIPSHWFYLYTDEGTAYYTVKDNWCPAEKFLQNANGPNNSWQNNGPQVADSIKQAAGLQPAYQYLLKYKAAAHDQPINAYSPTVQQRAAMEKPVIVELVAEEGKTINTDQLKAILLQHSLRTDVVYQWKNHCVTYDVIKAPQQLRSQLAAAFPGVTVKLYDTAFYVFDRRQCDSLGIAKEWDHTIITANLVADPVLQKEYLDYHATQFEKWPEISKGFCKASFQQLLVYKNGRQLMLVISIPKGESLDKLNPKTIENNPRVADWNTIMKKYQQGIEGTAPGEVWVQLK